MSSKKTSSTGSSTQDTAQHAVTTSQVPDWIAQPTQQLAGQIGGLIQQGPAPFTPGISDLQQKAFTAAQGITAPNKYFDEAGGALGNVPDVTAQQVQASSLLDNGLDRYYNPFKDQVLNPVLNDYDAQSGMTRAAQAAAGARNDAFAGSRYGVQEAQTEGQLARGRSATEGTLLNQMYGQATTLAEQDAARRQAAAIANQGASLAAGQSNQSAALQRAQQLAALGISSGADTRANLGMQADLGNTQTTLENTAKQYPLTFAAQGGALLQGLDPSIYTGHTVDSTGHTTGTTQSTTKEDPGLLGSLGQAAQIASLFVKPIPIPGISDRRAKQDVRTEGYDAKGRRWVSFAYIWAPWKRLLGVIAQEVRRTDPGAVFTLPGGVLAVDYGALV